MVGLSYLVRQFHSFHLKIKVDSHHTVIAIHWSYGVVEGNKAEYFSKTKSIFKYFKIFNN